MKANEVRIGNLYSDTIGKVCKIDADDIEILYGNIDYYEYRPIPITIEKLKTLRQFINIYGLCFRFNHNDYEYGDNFICVQMGSDDWHVYIHDTSKNIDTLINHVSYLHELQNLLFVLNNEEIDVSNLL